MRKKKNGKKKTIYTVLLIVVAVLIVGYAYLSSTLNIFGGLSIIGGNNWGVKWNNIQINNDSTGIAIEAPAISSNETTVNFTVKLDQPGKFYEFTVDAVNTGTIDAMIDSINYAVYDQDDNEVYPEYLIYTVEYDNGISLATNHLLAAGDTATYKVRLEFTTDVDPEELPSGEEQLRFEFGVTYIQADSSAVVPGSNVGDSEFTVLKRRNSADEGEEYTYTYNEGMTWEDWVDSSFNVDGWVSDGSNIYDPDYYGAYLRYYQSGYYYVVPIGNEISSSLEYYMDVSECCFEPTTLIQTDLAGHTKMIKDFEVGDSIVVQSVITGEKYVTTVMKEASEHPDTYDFGVVTLENGTVLRFNSYHPIYTTEGYKSLTNYNGYEMLTEDDVVVLSDGSEMPIKNIQTMWVDNPEMTYNLLIKGINEYYLEEEFGYFANGVLVHTGIAKYDDEDAWREKNRNKCTNVEMYKDFDYDNVSDAEAIEFLANLKVVNEDAFNEYIKYYMTADQYTRYATFAKEVKARATELEKQGNRVTYNGFNHYKEFK